MYLCVCHGLSCYRHERVAASLRAGRLPCTAFEIGDLLHEILEKVFRPAVIEVLDDPLAAAKLGDTVLAAQAFQHDADLVFSREVSSRRTTDVLLDLCRRFFPRQRFLSHLRSLRGLR